MKNILSFSALIIVCLSLLACSSSKQVLNIDPNQSVEVAFNDFTSYEAKVSNKSMKDIEVKVIDKSSAEQTSGFGLAQMASDKVMVSEASKLILKNTGDKTAKVVVAAKKSKNKKELTDTCCICICDFGDEEILLVTRCEHIFHKQCIQQWINHKLNIASRESIESPVCPSCRANIQIKR